jgi:adenylate cyclase
MSLYYAVAMSRELVDPVLQAPMAWQRGVLFILCGVLAERFTHVMSRMVYDVQETTAEADRIRRAFGAYVADPVVHRVLSGDLRLTTERRHATVLFVDIRNFTATTAGLPADLVLSRLNLALDRFSRQVLRKRGIVNKFLGDGMLALFGAPEDDPMHVQHAFEAARAILVEADRLRLTGEYPALQVGIGMATGEVLVGDVGGASQREYTAIGATVNLAARLEQRTKDLGVPLLLCGRVARALGPHAAIRRLPPIRVRGVPGEVGVWTVDAPDAEAMSHAEVSGHWGMTLDAIPELSEEHDRRRSTQEVPAARGPAPPVAMRRPR